MYKIGEFSKLCKLSVKTLRYYADIGLLEPKFTDTFSGYRYYSTEQLNDVARIHALKEMGFSLVEIQNAKDNMAELLEEKEKEIHLQIQELQEKLKRLVASKDFVQKEAVPMFHVVLKRQERVKVSSVRQIFSSREEAMDLIKKKMTEHNFKQVIVVNYENEFREEDLDLEIAFPYSHGNRELFRGIEIPGYESEEEALVASVICEEDKLDDAYSYLVRYLRESMDYQVMGDAYEWYLPDYMVELQLPVHKLQQRTERPVLDDISLPFEDDTEALGRWKVVDCPMTKDGFNPLHCNWQPMDGDIREIYFLPEGERYWCFGWTKGYLLSRFSVPIVEGLNPYQIEIIRDKKYMFVWFKDRDCFHRGALPSLIVLEQIDSRKYTKEEIRVRDEMTVGFEDDKMIHGAWKVCDFVRNPDVYCHGEYNAGFSKEKLYFKRVSFEKDGTCEVQYGEEILTNPDVDWTKGYVREQRSKLMQKYERRIIEETEYLFVEFKSGDYFYNHQKPWWYVFTRVAEE